MAHAVLTCCVDLYVLVLSPPSITDFCAFWDAIFVLLIGRDRSVAGRLVSEGTGPEPRQFGLRQPPHSAPPRAPRPLAPRREEAGVILLLIGRYICARNFTNGFSLKAERWCPSRLRSCSVSHYAMQVREELLRVCLVALPRQPNVVAMETALLLLEDRLLNEPTSSPPPHHLVFYKVRSSPSV